MGTYPATRLAAGTRPDGLEPPTAAALARAALAVAGRLHRGGTLWCLAPEWPEHARHLAVEFVHPVVVGTRALPAVAVSAADPVAALRAWTTPGDVLALLGPARSTVARDAARRAPAWGVTTLWLGEGARPAAGRADHLVWIDDDTGTARSDGRLVLRYHVLWELTHVCLEHPGILAGAGTGGTDDDVACPSCRDEGRPAEVGAVTADGRASVRTARGRETVDATLVGAVAPGDLVLVHAGVAIARLEPDDG